MVLISSDRLEVKILMAPDDMGKLWVWRISWWLDTWKGRQLSRAARVKSDPGLLQLLITNYMSNVDQPPEHLGSHQSFEFTRYIRHHSSSFVIIGPSFISKSSPRKAHCIWGGCPDHHHPSSAACHCRPCSWMDACSSALLKWSSVYFSDILWHLLWNAEDLDQARRISK